jgi:hypothetical protein
MHVDNLQKWIEKSISHKCCIRQDVEDIIKLLERCAQVLRLITSQDKIERIFVIFASQGEFTAAIHEIAEELMKRCNIFYSETVIATFNALKTAKDTNPSTVETAFMNAAKT